MVGRGRSGVLSCLYLILTPGYETSQALDVLNSPRASAPHIRSSLFSSWQYFQVNSVPSPRQDLPQIAYLYAWIGFSLESTAMHAGCLAGGGRLHKRKVTGSLEKQKPKKVCSHIDSEYYQSSCENLFLLDAFRVQCQL